MKPPIPTLPADLLQALNLSRFVAFDVETTGLDPNVERVIEIAAVRFVNGSEEDKFISLIVCPFSLPPFITNLTGIRDSMLKGQPREDVVFRNFMDFAGDDPLVGHNVSFDLSFLKAALRRSGLTRKLAGNRAVDTALLARVLLPTIPSRSLSSLGSYFNLYAKEKHRAEPDARQAGRILLHLLSHFNRIDITAADLMRRLADGLPHPSAWIFSAWAEYLIKTSSVEGRLRPYQLPYLTDNVIGRIPAAASIEAARVQADEEAAYLKIDEEEVAVFFREKGPLSKELSSFESRPQQVQMATAVAAALNEGGLLAVEAGTGVGKSLAYLVPAIHWAKANGDLGERVIVSTNTRNLQEQLFFKDLPALVEALPLKFSAVLLKGRNNYLCRRRWVNLTSDQPLRLSNNERQALLPLVLWAEQTRTGDIAEVSAFGGEGSGALWMRIASDAGSCRGKRCRERHRCFHNRIRTAAGRSHVVVVNHALLMSDLASNRVPIGAYKTLVIDEAHHLERAASQHLGKELSSWMFRFWTNRMFEPAAVPTGFLAQMLLGMGAASSDHPVLPALTKVVEAAANDVAVLNRASADFFQKLTASLQAAIPPQQNTYTQKLRLRQPDQFLDELPGTASPLIQAALKAEKSIAQIITTLGDIPSGVLPRGDEWVDDLRGAQEEIRNYRQTLEFFTAPPDDNWVYWAELPRRSENDAILYAAPLNAGEILKQHLFDPLRTGIMTSATLTVADRFHYFLRKIGLKEEENVATLKLGSPFDFERQMLIGLTAYLPSPKNPHFEAEVIQLIESLLKKLQRGTLGLFTSHRMLQAVGRALEKSKTAKRLLVQGQSGSRDRLLRQFRDEPGSVLLGTDSFWEGIDVMGEALELLFVAKLPFEVPSEPLVEARLEKLKSEGKDPFMYYTVPEAVIRLRQGIGRLIRSKSDRGVALICDSRLVSTRYGEAFLQSLPVHVEIFNSQDDIIAALKSFFERKEGEDRED